MIGIRLTPRLCFSYGQFLVYDQSVSLPGCLWTEKHTAQGFARRESTVCIRTLLEFGDADVTYILGHYTPKSSYERVIAVPFTAQTDKLIVDGPEEINVKRFVILPTGYYRLVAAQTITGDEEEAVDLFFEKLEEPLRQSAVIVSDEALEVPDTLLETSDVA